jgi:hypothetical protein
MNLELRMLNGRPCVSRLSRFKNICVYPRPSVVLTNNSYLRGSAL